MSNFVCNPLPHAFGRLPRLSWCCQLLHGLRGGPNKTRSNKIPVQVQKRRMPRQLRHERRSDVRTQPQNRGQGQREIRGVRRANAPTISKMSDKVIFPKLILASNLEQCILLIVDIQSQVLGI